MKKISILAIMKGINDVTGTAMYQVEDVVKVAADGKPIEAPKGKLVVEREKAYSVYSLTTVGSTVLDIFRTIDAINQLDLRYSKKIGEFDYDEYSITECFKMFIRPSRAIIGGEVEGIRQKDALSNYSAFVPEGLGEVLTPEGFENAQLRLLRSINRKCTALVGASAVVRDKLILTEKHFMTMPVIINGEMKAVSRKDSFEVFSLQDARYEDYEYIVSYNSNYVNDAMLQLGKALLKTSSERGSLASSGAND